MLNIEEAVEIASVIFQREVRNQELTNLISGRIFSSRDEFRAFLLETEEFEANYPDVHYALVAAMSERIARAQVAHQITGLQDEIEALRRVNLIQEGEIVRLAGELDRFISSSRLNGKRLAEVERSISDTIQRMRNVR